MKTRKALSALSALAQESRLSVFMLLMQSDEGMPAGDIARDLDIPLTTMSFHLSQLKSAGLVDARKDGRFIIYTANRKKAKKLAQYIMCKNKDESADTLADEKYQIS